MSVIDTQALVIGAGPVGLFQVFQLGLQEIGAHVVDVLPEPGGQCVALYPDKPIYDIPGLPVCTGRELTERLLAQIAPFRAPMHLGQQVHTLTRLDDGRWHLTTSGGLAFHASTVFIAAGVGAFVPRKAAIDGLAPHEDRQVFYHPAPDAALDGRHVVVLGGEDAALLTALDLVQSSRCNSVTLLHRTDKFKPDDPALDAEVAQALASGRLQLVVGQPMEAEADADGHLVALQVATPGDTTVRLPLDTLLPRLGLSPRLGPLADWGLAMERKQLTVAPDTFATSAPGVFAVGDVNSYPGKRKLILCGFHEATLAAFAAAGIVYPERRSLMQYTTTSPRLHELLGVATPANT